MVDLVRLKQALDPRRYLAQPPEGGVDPTDHPDVAGWSAGFDAAWYVRRYPDVAGSEQSPLDNYLAEGWMLGRDPGPLFDTLWYLSKNPDVAAAKINPLVHYLDHGSHEFRDPTPIFDSQWYFATYPEARAPGLDASAHYFAEGHRLGYSPSAFFDTKWYLETYPEVAASGVDPLLHYLLQGAEQGYNPGPNFDTQSYVAHNPDCEISGKNPLVHFLFEEETRRQGSSLSERSGAIRPSTAATHQVDALVALLSDIEADLRRLAGKTAGLATQVHADDGVVQRWRSLYLSLFKLPRLIVLTGSIDDTPELAGLAAAASDLLLLETDSDVACQAEHLPRGAHWRSLAEFGPALDLDGQVKLITAVVNNLQPDAVLVWGSRAGWEMLARHGGELRHHARLFATSAELHDAAEPDPIITYFRSVLPWITGLYAAELAHLQRAADLLGLPRSQREKLRAIGDIGAADGFLSSPRAAS